RVAAGISRTVEVTRFGRADGLRTSECNGRRQPSAWKGRDGRLWFATPRGAAVVDPAALPHNRLPPPVEIEEILADGRALPAGSSIDLSPGTVTLEIHYTGLSLRAPEQL